MSRAASLISHHPFRTAAGLVVFAGAAVVIWIGLGIVRVPHVDVPMVVPAAPQLQASGSSQTVYRIDASRSSAGYEVTEELAGTSHTATGTTSGIAGDIVIDEANPSRSKVGEIVINVEQLTSDQELRDQRLRNDFLQSSHFPLAHFTTNTITGLPNAIADGTEYRLNLQGDLKVKDITKPATLEATVTRKNGELKVKASTTVKLTDYGVGPISMAGFVKTGNDAKLNFDLTAVTTDHTVPSIVAAPARNVTTSGTSPSFARAVQPVLEKQCASCHGGQGVGSHVLKLDTAGDASKFASGLGLVTGSGYMPPWPATDVGIPFEHARKLSTQEIKDISDWAAAGGPLDVDAATPLKAAPPEPGATIRTDLELKLPEPYQGSPDKQNDYRCFLLDPKFAKTTFITGFQFEPDKTELVHHALLFKSKAPIRDKVDGLDAASEGSGWPCYAGTAGPGGEISPGGSSRSSEQLTAWAPGQTATVYPDDVGIRMDPGDFLVVQVHYHYAHSAPVDQSRVRLQLAAGDDLDEVHSETYLGPAEIPCTKTETGPLCSRDASLEQLVKQYGAPAKLIANGLLVVCDAKLDDFKDMTDGIASSTCSHTIDQDGQLLSVFGHEHQLGKSVRITLNPGAPDEKVLLDIPKWDFNWQLMYTPKDQIELHKGDTIKVDCVWDRSQSTSSVPKYVTWAEGTEDEMCYSLLTTRVRRNR